MPVTDSCSTYALHSDATTDVAELDATEIDISLEHIDEIDREQRWSARFEATSSQLDGEENAFVAPLVFELGAIRTLLANWAFVQSAMRIPDPVRKTENGRVGQERFSTGRHER